MDIKSIVSRAPTRIDLAGGTVDIWPLYLFLKNPLTLNLGIDLFAEARLDFVPAAKRGTSKIRFISGDQGTELELDASEIENPRAPVFPLVELHWKLLRHFWREFGLSEHCRNLDITLRTQARSPAGAGLGGSSTLSIAIIGALASWAQGAPVDPERDGEKLIEIVRDIETTVIQVPAGLQDYYGAMYGGLQRLHWSAGRHHRQWLPDNIRLHLEKRLLLFYSGQSRNSGINNWALYKGFIDKKDDIRKKFEAIGDATVRLEQALRDGHWEDVGFAIEQEWETRRTLAPGISTPEIDRAFAQARSQSPIAGKICGAGGGGCVFAYSAQELSPQDRSRFEKIFAESGMRPLPIRSTAQGLDVQMDAAVTRA